jgi:hypothetical protein
VFCPNCGEEIQPPDQKYCQLCGADIQLNSDKLKAQTVTDEEFNQGKSSNLSLILSIISFLLTSSASIACLAFIFSIRASLYSSFGMIRYESIFFPSWGVIPSSQSRVYVRIIGGSIIALCIIGILLGALSLILRKRALSKEAADKSFKLELIFSLLGIIIAILGIFVGYILFHAIPFIVAIV